MLQINDFEWSKGYGYWSGKYNNLHIHISALGMGMLTGSIYVKLRHINHLIYSYAYFYNHNWSPKKVLMDVIEKAGFFENMPCEAGYRFNIDPNNMPELDNILTAVEKGE